MLRLKLLSTSHNKMKSLFSNISARFRFFMFRYLRFILRPFYRWFWKPSNDINRVIDDYSRGRDSIRFLQIGTNDGLINDPIIKFIVRDKWQGVRVEPLNAPLVYLNFLHGGNDGVKPVQCLIGAETGSAELFQVSFSKKRWATGIASMDRSNLQRMVDNGYIKSKANKYNEALPADKKDWIISETLEIREINQFISEHFKAGLEILQMDVEGLDHSLIMALNLQIHSPSIIAFEIMHLSPKELEQCESKLKGHGYSIIISGGDMLAYKSDHI